VYGLREPAIFAKDRLVIGYTRSPGSSRLWVAEDRGFSTSIIFRRTVVDYFGVEDGASDAWRDVPFAPRRNAAVDANLSGADMSCSACWPKCRRLHHGDAGD